MSEKLTDIINNTVLTPVIVNKNSNFVMITYWWGRGNKNLNTQKPCRDELKPGESLIKEPIKYEEMIDNWVRSCKKNKCNYLVQEYPQFAVPGGYQKAINAKPLFIKKALDSCDGRAVVYIDGDMTVNNYPHIFDMSNVDFMARGWNIDPRGSIHYLTKPICFDPFTFETSGGTMYFGNTEQSRHLLTMWETLSSKKMFEGKADDRILSLLVNSKSLFTSMNILQLPIEYLWLTDNYENKDLPYLNKDHYDKNLVIFEHAACLTSEEKAQELGAAKNREPKFYDKLVEFTIECESEGGIFNEFIIFENKKQSASWKKYLEYMSNATVYIDSDGTNINPYYLIKYNEVYGKKNDMAEDNIRLAKLIINILKILNINFLNANKVINIMIDNKIHYTDNILYTTELIPTILALQHLGYNVIYLPKNYDVTLLKHTIMNINKYEFIVNIINDNFNYPKFDNKSPIYFNKNSRILQHIIKISRDMQDFNKNLNSCALYIQLIRCKFSLKGQIKSPTKIKSLERKTDMIKLIKEEYYNFYDKKTKTNKKVPINIRSLSMTKINKGYIKPSKDSNASKTSKTSKGSKNSKGSKKSNSYNSAKSPSPVNSYKSVKSPSPINSYKSAKSPSPSK